MKTIVLPINLENNNDSFIINEYRREVSSCIRLSYNRLKDGLKQKEIRNWFKENINFKYLDSWFIQSSIYEAISMFEKDLESSKKTNKFPKRIFGGKNNLRLRCQNKITKKDFKSRRMTFITSIGEAPKKGNRKFEFEKEYITFKPYKGIKVKLNLPKLKNSYKKDYYKIVEFSKQNILPIQVKISDTHIYISYEETLLHEKEIYVPIKNRYCGIDLNPNYIGMSIVENEKIIYTQLFDLKDLTGKNINYNKLDYEVIQIYHEIGRICKNLKCEFIFLEDLSFSQGNKGKGKWFNRLTQNQWNTTIPYQILSKYLKVFKINSAYSSTIGNIINDSYPDPIASSLEIGRRGYSVIIKKNMKFYPDFISITKLQDRWKETDFSDINDWKSLHVLLKESKVKYRIPIPDRSSFKSFQNRKSKVFTYCI